jgi:hypothetical protein
MRNARALIVGLMVPLSACLNNPTIEEEIAEKCGVSVNDYERAEATLDKGHDGMSVRVGRCRLTRTAEGITDGTIVDDPR